MQTEVCMNSQAVSTRAFTVPGKVHGCKSVPKAPCEPVRSLCGIGQVHLFSEWALFWDLGQKAGARGWWGLLGSGAVKHSQDCVQVLCLCSVLKRLQRNLLRHGLKVGKQILSIPFCKTADKSVERTPFRMILCTLR